MSSRLHYITLDLKAHVYNYVRMASISIDLINGSLT